MPTAQLGAVLRHIRNLAADSKGKLQTDGELLRSFLARKDQGAFETMVRRHGPMVLQVCRRVLGNLHDAEDAFQATFLVLAQQVVSIRKRESLASWLHGVAYRMATNARRAAARRRKHEQQARLVRPRDPATRAAWQEIQVALDEEIQRLPAIYREPFVLCCLEHKSCAEAASRLSQKEGAVWNRLTRARKMLQERLARRGVSLTAALAAVGLSADAVLAAVPHSLLCSTVKGAVQVAAGQALTSVVPAQVIALVKGANQAMLLTKCKTAMLLLLSAGVVGSGLGLAVLRGADPEAPKESQSPAAKASSTPGRSEAQPAKAEPKKDDAQVEVRGRVLDPDGKPFAGAKLYLHAPNFRDKGYAVRATSDDNGRFQLTFAKSELTAPDDPQQSPTGQVMAVAKGYGCDWASIVADGKAGELTLRLVKDVPISGRILDPDGKPVAGAKLTVTSISAPKGDDIGSYVEAVRKGDFRYTFAKSWAGPLAGQPAMLTTGADGRFKLAGVGRERVVNFHLEGPAIATTGLQVMTHAGQTVAGDFPGGRVKLYGASFDYLAVASRPIRGVVRDQKTGKPVVGAWVFFEYWMNPTYKVNPIKALTDKEGRYDLLGLAKSPRYTLAVRPADGQLYFQRQIGVRDTPGFEPLTADIDMVRGLTVRGKVTDKVTGKPVAGAMVDYHPLYANPNVTKLAGMWSPRSEATTGPDGSYALTVLPGQGLIGVVWAKPDAYMPAHVSLKERKDFFKTPIFEFNGDGMVWAIGGNAFNPLQGGWHALVLLEPKEEDKALVRDLALEPAQERKGRVVGPDGKPIAGVTVSGLSSVWYITETLKGAEFTVRGLNPRGKRQLIFHHKDRNLALYLNELPDEKSGPLTIKLQSCGSVSGRIVDQDGQPLAGLRTPGGGRHNLEFTTDKEGRFRVEGLVPGVTYWVMKPKVVATLLVSVVVEPGKNKDLGDVKLDTGPGN